MASRARSGAMGFSHGSAGPEELMQWVHSRLHQAPVIWIQSAERRRKGAAGACPAAGSLVNRGRLIRLDIGAGSYTLPLSDATWARRGSLAAEYDGRRGRIVTTA